MATDLKQLALDFIAERQYEMALQVLTKAYVDRDIEAMMLMGDIYADGRFEGQNVYRAMVCYIEAQQNGLDAKAKILDLLQRDLCLPDKLTMDHLMDQMWEAFSKEQTRYMEVFTLLVVSHLPGYEPYVQRLIEACEAYLSAHPNDLLSLRCLSFLYSTFGEKNTLSRLAALQKQIVDLDPSPSAIETYLRYSSIYNPNEEPSEELWSYIDRLEKTDPEAYWYFSGVHYFHANRFAEAFQAFEVGTTRFGGRSQVALGYCYMYGIGVAKDAQRAIELLTPLRYQYPIANMYLAHERLFRELCVESFIEALNLNQLMTTEYQFESMIECLWLCVAFLSQFDGGEEVRAKVRQCLELLTEEDDGDVYALAGLLARLKVLPEYTEEDADTLFFKGYMRGSAIGTLALTALTSMGGALVVEGFEQVGRNKEVDPHLRAVCYLNSFLHALVLDQYDVKQAERCLTQIALLEPAFVQHIEGLRLIGFFAGKVHDIDALIGWNMTYQAQYPHCKLPSIVEALLQGRFAESVGEFSQDPQLEGDLVSVHVLAFLTTKLTDDKAARKVFVHWLNKLSPLSDFQWLAEAFSGRLFPRDLRPLE